MSPPRNLPPDIPVVQGRPDHKRLYKTVVARVILTAEKMADEDGNRDVTDIDTKLLDEVLGFLKRKGVKVVIQVEVADGSF